MGLWQKVRFGIKVQRLKGKKRSVPQSEWRWSVYKKKGVSGWDCGRVGVGA